MAALIVAINCLLGDLDVAELSTGDLNLAEWWLTPAELSTG